MNYIDQFGRIISGLSKGQSSIRENLSPDEEGSVFTIVNGESIAVHGSLVVTAKVYAEDSFVIDHPVYGDIDSPLLNIDGGYNDEAEFELFNVEF